MAAHGGLASSVCRQSVVGVRTPGAAAAVGSRGVRTARGGAPGVLRLHARGCTQRGPVRSAQRVLRMSHALQHSMGLHTSAHYGLRHIHTPWASTHRHVMVFDTSTRHGHRHIMGVHTLWATHHLWRHPHHHTIGDTSTHHGLHIHTSASYTRAKNNFAFGTKSFTCNCYMHCCNPTPIIHTPW